MKITEVRIFPTESKDGKLKAFATMTFDDWFVVRNVKIIQGASGLFVAMPSRKAMNSCPKCRSKNVVGSRFCNHCGGALDQRAISEENVQEQQGNHMDIAHPITKECRLYIQSEILAEYERQAKQFQGKARSSAGNTGTVSNDRPASTTKVENPEPKSNGSSEIDSGMDIEL